MKYKTLLFLVVVPVFCFGRDYKEPAYLLKATKSAFKRIGKHQVKIRSLDFTVERQRAFALRLFRKEQKLIAFACLDINRLDNTSDEFVKRSFEQILLTVCAIITYLSRNVLYKTFNGSFFEGGREALLFCQEVHMSKLENWVSKGGFQHINHSLVTIMNEAINQLKETLLAISERYS